MWGSVGGGGVAAGAEGVEVGDPASVVLGVDGQVEVNGEEELELQCVELP